MGCSGSKEDMKNPKGGNNKSSRPPGPREDYFEGATSDYLPSVAIVGAGFLGARIAAELLLLDAEVSVYDSSLAQEGQVRGQELLEERVFTPLLECEKNGLLELAGIQAPVKHGNGGISWEPYPGEGVRAPKWCRSMADAVRGKRIVIESVPDNIDIKATVFSDAAQFAHPGVLLATSTITLPLCDIQEKVGAKLVAAGVGQPDANEEAKLATLEDMKKIAVENEDYLDAERYKKEIAMIKKNQAYKPRVVGLRFLAPVVFVPFVEVTLSAAQEDTEDREDLMALLALLKKGAFVCDVQGAAEPVREAHANIRLGVERLRLNTRTAALRQQGEARVRKAHREGPEAVARLSPATMMLFGGGQEELCCICLTAAPTVTSLFCGHRAMCGACADIVEAGDKRCPLCRERFARSVDQTSDARSI